MSFDCGAISGRSTNYHKSVLFESTKSAISSDNVCVRLYFETEYDIYQTRGSVLSVENFVSAIFNQVATLYQNENIEVRISEIFIWVSPDPYTSADLNDLLEEFQNYRTSFTGDLGQLLTFRPEVNGGIAASFDGLCNPSIADRLSAAMIYNTYNTVPTYSFTVQIITHEFGHLFGSRHTHACVWNGDNTAIDGCGSCMENPDPTIHNCNNCPRPPIPTNGGTIMSYCHTQSVGINFNLGFGPQPGNVIRNSVASADCLCECVNAIISGPDVICSTGVYTLINLPAGATVTSWKVTPALMVTVSGNDTTKTITKRGFLSGSVTLTVNITTDCGDLTVEEEIYVGATPIAIEGAFDPSTHARVSLLCAGNSYYFKVIETMPPAEPGTSYSWTLTPPPSSGLLPVSGSGTQPTFTFNVSGQYSLSVWKSNDCGDIPASTLLQVFNCN